MTRLRMCCAVQPRGASVDECCAACRARAHAGAGAGAGVGECVGFVRTAGPRGECTLFRSLGGGHTAAGAVSGSPTHL
jgi:hypothetical protein